MGGGQSDEESQKSSKRASIVDESTSHPERNTDHNLDNLIEVSSQANHPKDAVRRPPVDILIRKQFMNI